MPYKFKRTFKRRPAYRRRKATPWYNQKYSVATLATKALKGVSYLKGLVNSELHKIDIVQTQTPDALGYLYPMHSIAIGDNEGQRTGNSVLMRKIVNSIVVTKNASATTTNIKFMFVKDLQQAPDIFPLTSDILEPSFLATALAPRAPLNKGTIGRFTILGSRIVTLDNNSPIRNISLTRSMRHHVRYNGPSATDIQKGGMYLLMISDQPIATAPIVQLATRIQYHDN